MQPKTSVRKPIIAGARRQQLSELLRQWRKQPRQRSPLLFWGLLSLALLSDSGLLLVAAGYLGAWGPASAPVKQAIWENQMREHVAVGPALYASLLTVVSFTAAVAVRLRQPMWRRRLLFLGLLAGLGCLGCSVAYLGPTILYGAIRIGDNTQGILWSAFVVMALGLFLALLFRDAFLALSGALVSSAGFLAANYGPLLFADLWPTIPPEAAANFCLRVQVLISWTAYATWALAWGMSALALTRTLLAAPNNERLRRLAALCLWPIRFGAVLLAANALLYGWLMLAHFFCPAEKMEAHSWNGQEASMLLILAGCIVFFYARRRGWLQPFGLLAAVVLAFPAMAMMGNFVAGLMSGELPLCYALAADAEFYLAGLFSLSLTTHAALSYRLSRAHS